MNIGIEYIASLLLIGALVAMAVRRLNIPYTLGLMLTGIVLAVSLFPSDDIEITKELIFHGHNQISQCSFIIVLDKKKYQQVEHLI